MKEIEYAEKLEAELATTEFDLSLCQEENFELTNENEKLKEKIAQAYQTIGQLADNNNIVDEEIAKALDYFADTEKFDEDFRLNEIYKESSIQQRLAWAINEKSDLFTDEELAWLSEPLLEKFQNQG